MMKRAPWICAALLCAAGCGGGPPAPQDTTPVSRPGPNAVPAVSPADRVRTGASAPATAAAPAPAPAAAPAVAPAAAPAPAPAAPVVAPAPAAPAPEAAPAVAPAAPAAPSLYDRLGGAAAIAIVVDTFVMRVHGDTTIAPLFRGVDMDNFKRLMRELLCQGTGGGCAYTGRSMLAAHQGLNITNAQFDLVAGYMAATLDQFNVPPQEKGEVMAILGPMRPDVVGH